MSFIQCIFENRAFAQVCVCSLHTEVEAKGTSDRLTEDQLSALINKAELVKITDRYRPSGTWAFWYPEPDMDCTELETGQEVRLKTRGNSPFICESCFSPQAETCTRMKFTVLLLFHKTVTNNNIVSS